MIVVTCDCASSHASATRATLTPCAAAMGRIASTQSNARSRLPSGKSNTTRRDPAGRPLPTDSPDSSPPASGLHTISAIVSSASSGTSSRSMTRAEIV